MRGADLVARTLAEAGVRTIFSLSGNQIMSIYDACIDTDIRLIHVRQEAAAVYMADCWAQITGEVGVALIAAGPGFANGLSPVYSARAAESPVLLLSGDAPLSQAGRGAFQELEQVGMSAPVTKASFRAERAGDLGDDVARALRLARAGRPGPVHLVLPQDLLLGDAGNAVAPARPIHPAVLCRSVQIILDAADDPILIADGGEFGQWAQAFVDAPVRVVNGPAGHPVTASFRADYRRARAAHRR